jgi:hypothetical protein
MSLICICFSVLLYIIVDIIIEGLPENILQITNSATEEKCTDIRSKCSVSYSEIFLRGSTYEYPREN